MLAGLLFATQEASDRPGTLAATLPFGATTLIEYQARLLLASGAGQIVVVVARLTPDLTAAIGRIAQRGVSVDTVRRASEAVAVVHPLSRVVVLADSLVTTRALVALVADGSGDALLTLSEADAPTSFERLGGGMCWAGLARVEARRLADAAALPADWNLQSTLLRLAEQAGAARLVVASGELARGHGVERSAAALEKRGTAVLAASLDGGAGWFDRWLVRPAARLLAPAIARRGWSTAAVAAGGAALAALGVVGATTLGQDAAAGGRWLVLAVAGVVGLELGGGLGLARDEANWCRTTRAAIALTGILAIAGVAWRVDAGADMAARLLAIVAVVAALIAHRAEHGIARRRWWADPAGLLVVLAVGCVLGQPLAAIAFCAAYATATLAAAVEAQRRDT